jgi:hypothetical protein
MCDEDVPTQGNRSSSVSKLGCEEQFWTDEEEEGMDGEELK